MELQIPNNYHEDLKVSLEILIETKRQIFDQIVILLRKGECNYLSDDLYGYPYNYQVYAKDSLDPQVRILNTLIENVEKAFEELLARTQ